MTFASSHRSKSSILAFLVLFILMIGMTSTSEAASSPISASQAVAVTVDEIETGRSESFQIAVNLSDVSGLGVTAFNFTLTYDESLVVATSASIDSTLAGDAGMSLVYRVDAGKIVVAAAGVNAMAGAGKLVTLNFESLQQDGIAALDFEEFKLNEGNPEAQSTAGSIAITSAMKGDVTLNGEVSAYDAAQVLSHASFLDTLSVSAQLAADVSASNGVTSYDAALILQRVAGLIDCFPAEGCAVEKYKGTVTADVTWGIAEPDGMLVSMPLFIENVQGNLHALTLDVSAEDAQNLTFALETNLPEGWIVSYGQKNANTVRISMAGPTALTSGTRLVLQMDNHSAQLAASVSLNEQDAIQVDADEPTTVPSEFALEQNYPNPFNPTTSIRYALHEDLQVKLIVYDLLGREIKRLVDGPQTAGTHAISFDAEDLSSGIYIYRLEAGAFSETRQMTLVK